MNEALVKVIAAIIVFSVVLMLRGACAPGNDSVRAALDSAGYSEVVVGGAAYFGCAEDDVGRHFTAKNPAGKPTSGLVCCGDALSTKGCTIRH